MSVQMVRAKKSQALSEYVKQLRENAKIVYSNDEDDP